MVDKRGGANRWLRVMLAAASIIWATSGAIAAAGQQPAAGQSGDGVWQGVSGQTTTLDARRTDLGGPYSLVRLNKTTFDAIARRAPLESTARDAVVDVILTLPMPDGRYQRYRIQESPILAPELAAAFPEFKTYRGQGLDDPTATARFGWTAAGFHAIILSAGGTVYIDPWMRGNLDDYVSFHKADARRQGAGSICLVGDADPGAQSRAAGTFPMSNGDTKRTYRLALAATGEYTVAAGGTKELALSRMTTTINRVIGIYERDLSVTLTLLTGTTGDPTALIYTNGLTDPYTNGSASLMLGENQTNIDAVVGTANYDVGHVFATSGGGFADVGALCLAGFKAKGATGLSNPIGDAFDVDYVAHELGHQFGGNHTFNSASSNCGVSGGRSPLHAYEVGSGSTIMAYTAICSPENLQPNSSDQFHVESLNEITAFLTSGGGASCGTTVATGNALPTVSGGSNYTIPQQTPFTLTAIGSDANGDSITYQWDQFDLGTASSSVATASTDDGSRPLFRSYPQSSDPTRTFPSLTYVLNNSNVPPTTYSCPIGTCLTGEALPASNRTTNFQVTARDNRSGGGAVVTSRVQVTVTTAAGPFGVTSPNSNVSWASGTQTVTWNVAGTTASPVSTANVRISLSTDGGTTFPTVLASNTPNNGSAVVTIPNTATTTARIKVEAADNIYFDISDTNFSITGSPEAPSVTIHPSSQVVTAGRFASFTAAASGSPAPTVQWQVTTDGGATWSDITNATSATYGLTAGPADNGKRYRAVFTNSAGSATSSVATLTVYGPVSASPASLRFGAVKAGAGSALTSQTSAQTVTITFSGASNAWSATTTQSWLNITGGSGSAAGTFTVAIQNPNDVIGASTSLFGVVTITSPTAPNSPLSLPVILAVSRPGASALPFGAFDTPVDGTTGMQGSFAVTGWALDDVGIDRVEIWRDPVAGETTPTYYGPGQPGHGKIFIANPLFITGSRTDVEGAYPNYPFANRSGWGYLLLSWGLWNQGNATYKLYAFAFDAEGRSTSLGTKTITVANASATKPFGAIDTPEYGSTKSGGFWNYGWALTPNRTPPCTITNGNVQMGIDSQPLLAVSYGDLRSDIAASFPGFSNGTNSGGAYFIDTTTLTNGMHQIGWLVTDNCLRQDGVGSRFFTVLNAGADAAARAVRNGPAWVSPLAAARASSASADPVSVRQQDGDWQTVERNASGTRVIEVAQDGRIEVRLPPLASGSYAGYQDIGRSRRALPLGSSLDAAAGIFYWQPAPGFLGRYDLVFGPGIGRGALVRVRVVVGTAMRMAIDTPSEGADVPASFTVAGWAVDLAAREGTGVDAVHVWAYPAGGVAPIWLGVASYGDARRDVEAVFGSSTRWSAYRLEVNQLPPGTYDVVVYPHRARTNTFEGAQVVRVAVK